MSRRTPRTACPSARYRLYHEEKAKGGVGLTMMGGSAVVAPDSPAAFGNLHVYKDEIVPWLRELAYGVHENGAAVMCQITHLGRRTSNYDGDWLPVIAPSAIREPAHRAFPKVAEEWDMDRIVQGVRRRDGQMPGGGSRRHRTRGLHPSARLVLVPVDQSPRRRVRDGQPRGPTSVPAAGYPGSARGGGPGLRRRYPDVARRGHRRRPEVRRRRRDRQACGGRGYRLHQRHQGLHGQRRGAVARDPADGHAGRAAPRVRGPGQGGPADPGHARRAGSTTWRPRAMRSATG